MAKLTIANLLQCAVLDKVAHARCKGGHFDPLAGPQHGPVVPDVQALVQQYLANLPELPELPKQTPDIPPPGPKNSH